MIRVACLSAVLGGCFAPSFPDAKIACTDGLCPEGYRCDEGFCVAGAGLPVDDPDIDAAVADPPDAMGIDAMEVAVDAMTPPPCYGLPAVPITIGQTYSDDSSDDNYDNADGCNNGPTAGGDEHYYQLTLDQNQVPINLDINVDGDFDIVLRIRQGICDDEVAEFLCQDTGGDEFTNRDFDVAATYYIIVDSHNGDNGGNYDLTVSEP